MKTGIRMIALFSLPTSLNLPRVWGAQGFQDIDGTTSLSPWVMLSGLASGVSWAAAGGLHMVKSEAGGEEKRHSERERCVGGVQLWSSEREGGLGHGHVTSPLES